MKKIPTLFVREFENGRIVKVTDMVTEGCEEAFLHGTALTMIDGSCCAIIGGEFYRRYDAKHGKKAPDGAIPCCEPDPVTGHHPHWVRVSNDKAEDKWFVSAYQNALLSKGKGSRLSDGTYEAVGVHFQSNPYDVIYDTLVRHDSAPIIEVERTFEGVRNWLSEHKVEGIVFWLNGEPVCKIKRSDFGFSWK